MRQRADLRAAELAIHAAAARGRWEHARVLTLVATIDTQADRGALVPHPSVGVQNFELPIFNQNQGGVGRADASLTRAIHQYAATRIAVTAEVLSAWEIVERAEESLGTYDEILSALSEASGASTRSFENGAESYIVVVDALRRSAEAQLRRVELEAELVRAQAELDRAVGGRASGEML
ncbi:MAG: TolC family protein [Sandaracinaceae bacterium]|nr:TolC family protein [Sandaracinaceae bacterium]